MNTPPDLDLFKGNLVKKTYEDEISDETRLLEVTTNIVRPHIRGNKLVETIAFIPSSEQFFIAKPIKYYLLRYNIFSDIEVSIKEVSDKTLRFEGFTAVKLHFRKL